MSILSIFGVKPSASALLKAQKFGKTKEQKDVIDFFASGGKSGGCLSSNMDIAEYIELVERKANSIDFKARAMGKIGIDEDQISEIEPICLTNFRFASDCYSVVERIDNEVYAVSNEFSVAWLFFSESQMYVYTYIFDMMSNNVGEYVREYFYTDITCFRTVHHVVERIMTDAKGCGCSSKPIHADYDTDSLYITVPGEDYSISIRNSQESMNSIYAARAFVREKKYRA